MRAGLSSHPGDHLVEEQGDEEHPFRFREVRDGKHRQSGFASGAVEEVAYLERLTGQPVFESGRSQQVVELHRQAHAFGAPVEGFELEDTDSIEGWRLNATDQRGEVGTLLTLPRVAEQSREENVLAASAGGPG